MLTFDNFYLKNLYVNNVNIRHFASFPYYCRSKKYPMANNGNTDITNVLPPKYHSNATIIMHKILSESLLPSDTFWQNLSPEERGSHTTAVHWYHVTSCRRVRYPRGLSRLPCYKYHIIVSWLKYFLTCSTFRYK